MADYNPKTVSAYQQYASSMKAGGGGTNLSGSGAKAPPKMQTEYGNRKGLGSPTSRLDKKGYTPTTSLSTASGRDYVDNVSSEKDLPSANPAAILYSAAANANMEAGVTQTPSPLTPMNGMSLYSLQKMTEVVPQVTPYLYRMDMQEQAQDLVEQAMGYEPPLAQMTPDRRVWDYEKYSSLSSEDKDKAAEALQIVGERKMTPSEIKQFQPLIDMANEIANETITVEELAPLTQMDQEAKLKDILEVIESGGLSRITNIREVRSDNAVDPFTGLPFGGDELGFTDVSPSAEAAEQQGLMARSRVPTGSIEEAVREVYGLEEEPAVEAETPAVAEEEGTIPTEYGTAVFEMSTDLKKVEGTEPHIGEDWENVTLALGIVPTSGLKIDGKTVPSDRAKRGKWLKSNGYVSSKGKPTNKFKSATIDTSGAVKDGIKRSDYTSDTAWSAAVINNFKEGAQDKVEGFDDLGIAEQKAVIDIAWNMGVGGLDYSGNQSLIGELSKAPEERSISTMLEAGKHVTEGGKVMRGLARRKALAVNSLISDPNQKIEFIRQTSRGNKTYHTYVNAQGQAVKTLTLGKKHSGSPDGLISVETGEEVTDTQRETSPRPMLRPTE